MSRRLINGGPVNVGLVKGGLMNGVTTLAVALAVVMVTVVVDVSLGPGLVLTPLLIAGPLVAAAAGPARYTVYAGVVGLSGAFLLGFVNDVEFSRRHYISMITVLLGGVMGYELARRRERRERQLVRVLPRVHQAERLVRSMHSGSMGEWRLLLGEDRVVFDEGVAQAFGGIDPEPTGLPTAEWLARLEDRDRVMVRRRVEGALVRQIAFRFDVRCNWPDGSAHWLEVVGEPTFDLDGSLTGAEGLLWNVDERHRELDERARLLEVEHYARLRAEYVARVHDVLSRSVDVEEILRHVTRAAVPDLADWCSAVFVVDRPRAAPLIVSAHADQRMEAWARDVLHRFPYDPDGTVGAARVIREGRLELIEHISSSRHGASDSARDLLSQGAVDCIVTVPIHAQLGLLGSLQLIRGRHRPAFSVADITLAEELASRCGAALNSAVLLARQRTSSEALETLQRVSGWLARAATRHDVASATVNHGADGLRADGGCVYALDADAVLSPLSSVWLAPADRDGWLHALAARVVQEDRVIVETTRSGPLRTVLVAPCRILDRVIAVMLFVFDGCREFVAEELAMAVTLASRCAGALERAALYERERASVLTLQRRLLPQVPSIPDWLEVGYCYEPALGGQVGGDWFQLINLEDERVVAVVGDAVGHGLGAAAAMGQLKSSIATAVSVNPDPAEVLRTVDRFADAGSETLAATAVATTLERCGTFQLASAGHLPPVLLHPNGTSDLVLGGRRPLLGYGEGLPGAAEQRCLTVGDTMVLYSDGLVERRHEVLDVGIERLRRTLVDLQHRPPQEVCELLIDRMAGDGRTDDDIALLLLRYTGDLEPAAG